MFDETDSSTANDNFPEPETMTLSSLNSEKSSSAFLVLLVLFDSDILASANVLLLYKLLTSILTCDTKEIPSFKKIL